MATKIQKMKWELYKIKQKQLLLWGLKKGYIVPYNNELIEKLREIYFGGLPASIILLCNGISNGYCCDRALLMARAFLDGDDDINLIYAIVDSIKYNPRFISDSPTYAEHCFLERITKDGHHIIYDTSKGLIYDKSMYWLIENPKVRYINDKRAIQEYISQEDLDNPRDIEKDKYVAPLALPFIEKTFGANTELYSQEGASLLQREVEFYKELISYNALTEEINQIFPKH